MGMKEEEKKSAACEALRPEEEPPQHDIINSSMGDHSSPWGIAARLHICYEGNISLWYNNVGSLAVSAAGNDKIKLLNFPNSAWWVMKPSAYSALSSFTRDMLIVLRTFSVRRCVEF